MRRPTLPVQRRRQSMERAIRLGASNSHVSNSHVRGFAGYVRLLSCCLLILGGWSCTSNRGGELDANSVREQIARYTSALDAADPALGSQVWLTSPEVSFIWPLG